MTQDKQNPPFLKHDQLFRKSMDIIIVAREFFEINLEKEVKNLVNLDTLQVEKNSFVTGDLVNSVSDILYSVKF